MWFLQQQPNKRGPPVCQYLLCGQTLKVSRQPSSSIFLPNDKSVSREHATLTILHEKNYMGNPENLDEVVLKDSSKYGTFVNQGITNQKRVDQDHTLQLRTGDDIRFGLLENTWRLLYQPMIITSSQLKINSSLTNALIILGSFLVKEWTAKCDYLVMSNILLTAKTVCALASGKPIVTPQYFLDLLQAIKDKSIHPKPSSYLPPLKELSIDKEKACFLQNSQRTTLFNGKIFVFCSLKSLSKLGTVVNLAGGKSVLLCEDNINLLNCSSTILVKGIESQNDLAMELSNRALAMLKKQNLHSIPESDIGLAVVYVSTGKYCNPAFSVNRLLRRSDTQSDGHKSQSLDIFATQTQHLDEPLGEPSLKVITETIESSKCSSCSKSCIGSCNRTNPFPSQTQDIPANMTCKRERSSSRDELQPPPKKFNGVHLLKEQLLSNTIKTTVSDEDVDDFKPTVFSTQKPMVDVCVTKRKADLMSPMSIGSAPQSLEFNEMSLASLDLHAYDDIDQGRRKRKLHPPSPSQPTHTQEFALPTLTHLRRRQNAQQPNIIPETPSGSCPQQPKEGARPGASCSGKFVACKVRHNHSQQSQVKVEDDDVGETGDKSLVVVEIANLVVSLGKSMSRMCSFSGLESQCNFKRFTKAGTPRLQMVPQMVGGCDLIAHCDAVNGGGDLLADTSQTQPSQPTESDQEFQLPMQASRSRKHTLKA